MILSLAFIDWVSRTRRWKKVSSNTYFLSIRAYKPLRPPSRSDSSFGRYGLAITTPSSTASQSFFADTPYEVIAGQKPERDTELHYRNVLFIVFKLVGLYTQVEYHTSNGRIDLVLQTDRYVYIMEFKLNGTAEEALRQIEEKGYALPFAGDDREVFKIGVNFSSETRNIEKWLVG